MLSPLGAHRSVAHLTFVGADEPWISTLLVGPRWRAVVSRGTGRAAAQFAMKPPSMAVTIALGRPATACGLSGAMAASGGRWSSRRRGGKLSYSGAQRW